jgi:hypothetical protein
VTAVSNIVHQCEGPALAPYLPALAAAVLPLLSTDGAPIDDIRAAAAGVVVYLAGSAVSVITRREAAAAYAVACAAPAALESDPSAGACALRIVYGVFHALVGALKDERDHEMLTAFVTSILEGVKEACTLDGYRTDAAEAAEDAAAAAGGGGGEASKFCPLFNEHMLGQLTDALIMVRKDAVQRRAVRIAEMSVHAEDYDDDAREDVEVREGVWPANGVVKGGRHLANPILPPFWRRECRPSFLCVPHPRLPPHTRTRCSSGAGLGQ